MTAQDIKAFFAEQLVSARDFYAKDLGAMSDEDLGRSPGGSARTPYDFTHEVAIINRYIAQRIRGEDTQFPGGEGWVIAPPECRSKERAIADITSSVNDVIAAWNALPEGDILKPIMLKNGQTNALEYVYMCASHTGYHDAQLNYVQAMRGDMEVHW
jgi:hypothetical protein